MKRTSRIMYNFQEKIKWEIIVILNVLISLLYYIIILIYHINIITISLYDLVKNGYHS